MKHLILLVLLSFVVTSCGNNANVAVPSKLSPVIAPVTPGKTNPQVKPGQDGAQGSVGPAGKDGAPGVAGKTGPVGPAGKDGVPGVAGKTGPAGANGKDGLPGLNGAPGSRGPGSFWGASFGKDSNSRPLPPAVKLVNKKDSLSNLYIVNDTYVTCEEKSVKETRCYSWTLCNDGWVYTSEFKLPVSEITNNTTTENPFKFDDKTVLYFGTDKEGDYICKQFNKVSNSWTILKECPKAASVVAPTPEFIAEHISTSSEKAPSEVQVVNGKYKYDGQFFALGATYIELTADHLKLYRLTKTQNGAEWAHVSTFEVKTAPVASAPVIFKGFDGKPEDNKTIVPKSGDFARNNQDQIYVYLKNASTGVLAWENLNAQVSLSEGDVVSIINKVVKQVPGILSEEGTVTPEENFKGREVPLSSTYIKKDGDKETAYILFKNKWVPIGNNVTTITNVDGAPLQYFSGEGYPSSLMAADVKAGKVKTSDIYHDFKNCQISYFNGKEFVKWLDHVCKSDIANLEARIAALEARPAGQKGDKGDKGDTGAPGKDGLNGKDAAGATPTLPDLTGLYFILEGEVGKCLTFDKEYKRSVAVDCPVKEAPAELLSVAYSHTSTQDARTLGTAQTVTRGSKTYYKFSELSDVLFDASSEYVRPIAKAGTDTLTGIEIFKIVGGKWTYQRTLEIASSSVVVPEGHKHAHYEANYAGPANQLDTRGDDDTQYEIYINGGWRALTSKVTPMVDTRASFFTVENASMTKADLNSALVNELSALGRKGLVSGDVVEDVATCARVLITDSSEMALAANPACAMKKELESKIAELRTLIQDKPAPTGDFATKPAVAELQKQIDALNKKIDALKFKDTDTRSSIYKQAVTSASDISISEEELARLGKEKVELGDVVYGQNCTTFRYELVGGQALWTDFGTDPICAKVAAIKGLTKDEVAKMIEDAVNPIKKDVEDLKNRPQTYATWMNPNERGISAISKYFTRPVREGDRYLDLLNCVEYEYRNKTLKSVEETDATEEVAASESTESIEALTWVKTGVKADCSKSSALSQPFDGAMRKLGNVCSVYTIDQATQKGSWKKEEKCPISEPWNGALRYADKKCEVFANGEWVSSNACAASAPVPSSKIPLVNGMVVPNFDGSKCWVWVSGQRKDAAESEEMDAAQGWQELPSCPVKSTGSVTLNGAFYAQAIPGVTLSEMVSKLVGHYELPYRVGASANKVARVNETLYGWGSRGTNKVVGNLEIVDDAQVMFGFALPKDLVAAVRSGKKVTVRSAKLVLDVIKVSDKKLENVKDTELVALLNQDNAGSYDYNYALGTTYHTTQSWSELINHKGFFNTTTKTTSVDEDFSKKLLGTKEANYGNLYGYRYEYSINVANFTVDLSELFTTLAEENDPSGVYSSMPILFALADDMKLRYEPKLEIDWSVSK